MKIMITGGAGFIGSNLVKYLIQETDASCVVIDKLTYAGNLDSLADVADHPHFQFEKIDIVCPQAVEETITRNKPDALMHLAAESHVDRSIDAPAEFIQSNIVGTFQLLTAARKYYNQLPDDRKSRFRFLHVSTDEVYGSLNMSDPAFSESTPYAPHSPYSASKAAADHLVRAWHDTYRLPVVITNCSNNYGPCQFPEKLIPLVILKAIHGEPIPIYGNGQNIRDWLHVVDHARALYAVLTKGRIGETYNIGANNEISNIELVEQICGILDQQIPIDQNPRFSNDQKNSIETYRDLITMVADRPGHDLRYAIDAAKIETELGWRAEKDFADSLIETVGWYLENENWWSRMLSNDQLKRRGMLPCD